MGGKWSFDSENRKKYPKGKNVPYINLPKPDKYFQEAVEYVTTKFKGNIEVPQTSKYPYTHNESLKWLRNFIVERFKEFGDYEDAILEREILNHSVLSPMLNAGLLTPDIIIDEVLKVQNTVPLNSLGRFIRQIIGWREFIEVSIISKGTEQRNSNFFNPNDLCQIHFIQQVQEFSH